MLGCKIRAILLHNGTKYTPEALEPIILGLKDQGYEIVLFSTTFVYYSQKIYYIRQIGVC